MRFWQGYTALLRGHKLSTEKNIDMEFNPEVSIIMPVYNGANYLKEAIDSALAQTYKNIEVIVVNDGSNDGGKTEAIAKSYGNKIHYFYKENGGVATALNLGIKNALGEYISWLSHDDLYLPTKLEKQIRYLEQGQNKKLILYSDFEAIDLRTNISQIVKVGQVDPTNYKYNILYLLFRGGIHGCTMLIPKICFDDVDLFNKDLKTTQDYELWFKLVKKQAEFRWVPDVLIRTRWHEEQGTVLMSALHRREVDDLSCWAFDLFYEDFRSFSCEQIAGIVMLLNNKTLKNAPAHIVKSWPENQIQRNSLLHYIEDLQQLQKTRTALFRRIPFAKKFKEYPTLMKLFSVWYTTLTRIYHIFSISYRK